MTDSPKPWARLVSLGSTQEVVHITGSCFTIGRSADNDLSIENNKLVSQNHCKITLEDDGSIYLTDSSTNGTQVDGTKVKQRKAELHHGDEIHIVFKKNSAQSNVAYMFEQLNKKLSDTLEATQEYDHADVEYNTDPDEPAKKQMKLSDNAAASAVLPADVAPGKADEIEETLLCSICQELLHDCVSLQPCMHTYCAGCFSQWMKTSKACPTCRKKATSVAQNHILRNLIDIYLKAHPDKQRPADELEALDKKNAIKEPIVTLTGVRVRHNEYSDSDEYDDDDDDDEDASFGGYDAGPGAPFLLPMHVNVPVCKQCPGYQASRARFAGSANPPAADPATSGPAAFQCDLGTQQHIVCYCCMEMFPDRRNTPGVPAVSCDACSGLFCHLYWGCSRPDCRGCLTKLKDMNLEDSALNNILLQNPTESNILKDYLQSKSLTVKDLLTETCVKLDRGEFQLNNDFNCNFSGRNLKSDSIICNRCGAKALRQLAYFYRKSISPTDLPDDVTRRENCYWGKNCRTQKRLPHAEKWNHICEQTRFT